MSNQRDSARDPASGPGRSSPMLPESDEVLERQRRLAGLQAAWRAFTPPVEEGDANAAGALARDLREQQETLDDHLRLAQARPRNTEAADREAEAIGNRLERLDGGLDRYAELLCNHLEGVPQNQLCADLPSDDAARSNGFAALVDFILGVQPDLEKHGTLLDHPVTMLSTGEQGGHRRVVRDPATLTPKLRSISERVATNSDLDFSKIEQEFLEAARRCEERLTDKSICDMQARKAELGGAILAPQILRSVVFYNVTTWNIGWGSSPLPSGNGPPWKSSRTSANPASARSSCTTRAGEPPCTSPRACRFGSGSSQRSVISRCS